jgi:hypothetical protein
LIGRKKNPKRLRVFRVAHRAVDLKLDSPPAGAVS